MRGGARNRGQRREAANHDDETASTEQRRRGDETFGEEQGGGDSSELGVEGVEATPSAGSSEKRAPTSTWLQNNGWNVWSSQEAGWTPVHRSRQVSSLHLIFHQFHYDLIRFVFQPLAFLPQMVDGQISWCFDSWNLPYLVLNNICTFIWNNLP